MLAVLVVSAAGSFAWAQAPQGAIPRGVNVYVLPMSGGLDQYIALELTQRQSLQVVIDPSKAELIITERIGEDFEQTLRKLYEDREPEEEGLAGNDFERPTMRPLSSSRGMVFLVDRTTQQVLWSTRESPGGSEPDDLGKAAEKIVESLEKAQSGS